MKGKHDTIKISYGRRRRCWIGKLQNLRVFFQSLEKQYFQVDGKNYCEKHKDVALPKCEVCQETINGEHVTVNGDLGFIKSLNHCFPSGDKMHVNCFVCSECGETIKEKFFKDSENGKYLCLADYQVHS